MKNELKEKVMKFINNILEIIKLYKVVMPLRPGQRKLDSKTMKNDILPHIVLLEQVLIESLRNAAKDDKATIKKCLELHIRFKEKLDQFVQEEIDVEEVFEYLLEFKSYVHKLVVEDESIH